MSDHPDPAARGAAVLDPRSLRERLQAFERRALPTEGLRHAAVALVVIEEGHGAEIPGLPRLPQWSTDPAMLLTRRANGLNSHAGQWALPGGRIDDGESPEQAALRELAEEVGLQLEPSAILGRLDDYVSRSGYVITPVLMWGGVAPVLEPNPAEVASIHRIATREFLRPDAPILTQEPGSEQPVLRMPVGEQWIAAPTAAFLYQFREWLLCGRATRVAHLDQPRFAWR
jgi:8-oxo-dGTP pyrophosphatase MutT (NUDIX family)